MGATRPAPQLTGQAPERTKRRSGPGAAAPFGERASIVDLAVAVVVDAVWSAMNSHSPADTDSEGLLSGLRILDLSTYVAGPSGAMSLAQLGAEVVRIDPLGGATDTRRLPLDPAGHSLYWAGLNKAKRSIEVNLRSPAGRALVDRLLIESGPQGGIVITNAVGQEWLSYERLAGLRPDLIMIHISGRADGSPAVDYTVNCEVGLPYLTGPVDSQRPVNHVLPAWDLLTGLHAAVGILAAERVRSRTGRGRLVRIALSDVAVTTMAHLGFVADVAINGRGRPREGNYLYGSFGCDFATRDGDRVMVVALTDRHWKHLVELTGTGETIAALERSLGVDLGAEEARYRYREVLTALITPWFEAHSTDEVLDGLRSSQVLWGPYRTVEELVRRDDSLMASSELFTEVEHPGIGSFPTPGCVLSGAGPDGPAAAAPQLGADTASVLEEWLRITGSEIDALRSEGTIGGAKL